VTAAIYIVPQKDHPYRMHSVHKMRPIAIDGAAWSVCVPVCYSRL